MSKSKFMNRHNQNLNIFLKTIEQKVTVNDLSDRNIFWESPGTLNESTVLSIPEFLQG